MADHHDKEWPTENWTATCDHMGPDEKKLTVSGTVLFPGTGYTAELHEHKGGPIPFNPLILELELHVEEPQVGHDTETPTPVEYVVNGPAFDYQEVEIHGAGERLDVQHVE